MTTPSAWDAWRARQKGEHNATAPACSRCGALSVLDPCRSCAGTDELPLELALEEPGDDG